MATKKATESTKATKQKKTAPTKQPTTARVTKRLSALDAAAKILNQSGQPMTTKELIEAMAAKGYWRSPSGATPHATLSTAIACEITLKGTGSRFVKAEPGKFARSWPVEPKLCQFAT